MSALRTDAQFAVEFSHVSCFARGVGTEICAYGRSSLIYVWHRSFCSDSAIVRKNNYGFTWSALYTVNSFA